MRKTLDPEQLKEIGKKYDRRNAKAVASCRKWVKPNGSRRYLNRAREKYYEQLGQ